GLDPVVSFGRVSVFQPAVGIGDLHSVIVVHLIDRFCFRIRQRGAVGLGSEEGARENEDKEQNARDETTAKQFHLELLTKHLIWVNEEVYSVCRRRSSTGRSRFAIISGIDYGCIERRARHTKITP